LSKVRFPIAALIRREPDLLLLSNTIGYYSLLAVNLRIVVNMRVTIKEHVEFSERNPGVEEEELGFRS